MKRIRLLIIVSVVLIAGFGIYVLQATFSNSGDKARTKISSAERSYLEKYDRIKIGMSYDEVVSILGQPDRDAFGVRPTWKVNRSSLNQIAAYFGNSRLFQLRWMAVGRFVMEK
jgi:outer membrane protein assembly factor BamE (lipoprotein component of BamABCDE complex)